MLSLLIPLVIVGVVIVVFAISLTVRRHGESDRAGADCTSTTEIFKDPPTNRLMRVWVDPSGERHYVAEK